MARRLFIISLIALVFLFFRGWERAPITHPPGVLVEETPTQVDIPPEVFNIDDYKITRKAIFEIRARVLSSERYSMRHEGELSPIDLALGWGAMSNQSVVDQLKISQSSRWFRWRYEGLPPVPEQQIISSSSNMHMIPADRAIERRLKRLRKGEIILINGYLVDADHDSGWFWRSSMRRDDTGSGACELVYVESLQVLP